MRTPRWKWSAAEFGQKASRKGAGVQYAGTLPFPSGKPAGRARLVGALARGTAAGTPRAGRAGQRRVGTRAGFSVASQQEVSGGGYGPESPGDFAWLTPYPHERARTTASPRLLACSLPRGSGRRCCALFSATGTGAQRFAGCPSLGPRTSRSRTVRTSSARRPEPGRPKPTSKRSAIRAPKMASPSATSRISCASSARPPRSSRATRAVHAVLRGRPHRHRSW